VMMKTVLLISAFGRSIVEYPSDVMSG
jgi:hypothetical protein